VSGESQEPLGKLARGGHLESQGRLDHLVCKERKDQEENEVYPEWTDPWDQLVFQDHQDHLVKWERRDRREIQADQETQDLRVFVVCQADLVTMVKKVVLENLESLVMTVNQETKVHRVCRVCRVFRGRKVNVDQEVLQEKMAE